MGVELEGVVISGVHLLNHQPPICLDNDDGVQGGVFKTMRMAVNGLVGLSFLVPYMKFESTEFGEPIMLGFSVLRRWSHIILMGL